MASISLSLDIPLREEDDGTLWVNGTRVILDSLVAAFDLGATPEDIAQRYPSVPLADVYAIISYYLREAEEVQEYLQRRRREADSLRAEIEQQLDTTALRRRLLARRAEMSSTEKSSNPAFP